MKSKILKKLSLCLAAVLSVVTVFSACGDTPSSEPTKYRGENYRKELEKPTSRDNVYGMMYICYEGDRVNGWDYKTGMQLMSNMGVKVIRFDVPARDMFPVLDETKKNVTVIENARAMVKEAQSHGITVIGNYYSNYCSALGGWQSGDKILRRDYSDGSVYQQWLEDCQEMERLVATAIPEIKLWEMGNEPNHSETYTDGEVANLEEVAWIFAEKMYYSSLGIHAANKDNVTVMGAFTEPEGLGKSAYRNYEPREYWGKLKNKGRALSWLEYIYDAIDSGELPSLYYDDYFQCAAWHPYTFTYFDADEFVKENNKFYEIIKRREGKDKIVYLTEYGFSDGMQIQTQDGENRQQAIARMIKEVYTTIRDRMPYVESCCYFRAISDTRDRYWAKDNKGNPDWSMAMYGLIYDPNPCLDYPDYLPGEGYEVCSTETAVPGTPKPGAYAYQEIAGGSGALDLFMKK